MFQEQYHKILFEFFSQIMKPKVILSILVLKKARIPQTEVQRIFALAFPAPLRQQK
jgi:hypothetical protein